MESLNNNANVVIKMKGLGVLHHNGEEWEAILLRNISKHDLKIKVTKIGLDGLPMGDPEEYSVLPNAKRVEVITKNNSNVPPALQTNKFTYNTLSDDPKDSRWILDLSEELHKKPVKLSKKTPGVGLTLLTVSNAMLYTAALHDITKPYTMIDSQLQTLIQTPPQRNPRIMAEFVGMDIIWEAGVTETNIYSDGKLIFPLPKDSTVARYEVSIDNNCIDEVCPLPYGDFPLYYLHLVDMGTETFFEVTPKLAKASSILKRSFNIEKAEDLAQPDFVLFAEAIKDIVQNYEGKTNDCGFVMCSRLTDDMNNSLGGLVP